MLRPPRLSAMRRYPMTAAVMGCAAALSLAWWSRMNLMPLMMNPTWWPRQPWRLFTSALIHGGIIHLAFNLYWLWVFGSFIEYRFGRLATGAIYALLAAGSAAAEYAFFEGGVGLSGVGYGLFGLLWVLNRESGRFRDAMDQGTTQLFVGWFFLCIVLTVMDMMRIANFAHLSGAMLGGVLGYCVAWSGARKRAVIAGLAAVMLLLGVLASAARPYVNVSTRAYEVLVYEGYAALAAGRDADAVRILRQAVIMEQGHAENWHNLGLALSRLGRDKEAVEALDMARQLETRSRGDE